MTAFLTVDMLQAHAAPLNLSITQRHTDAPRPVLTARWLIGPDRHLTCRWQADDPAPDRPLI